MTVRTEISTPKLQHSNACGLIIIMSEEDIENSRAQGQEKLRKMIGHDGGISGVELNFGKVNVVQWYLCIVADNLAESVIQYGRFAGPELQCHTSHPREQHQP